MTASRFGAKRVGPLGLGEALDVALAPEADAAASYEALRVIGSHLAAELQTEPDTVAVAVGRDALDLLSGATDVLGALRIFSVVGRTSEGLRPEVTLQWITGRPPAGVPLLVFDRAIHSGRTLRALLADLRLGEPRSITVLVIDATPEGIAAVRDDQPNVKVVVPVQLRNS